jgi:hypothetical protein
MADLPGRQHARIQCNPPKFLVALRSAKAGSADIFLADVFLREYDEVVIGTSGTKVPDA